MNRIFIGILLTIAAVWLWAEFSLRKQIDSDRVFQREVVDPYIKNVQGQSSDFQQALKKRERGEIAPLPMPESIGTEPIQEAVDRMKRRHEWLNITSLSKLALIITGFIWVIALAIRNEVNRRKWESAERPPLPTAGAVIEKLVRSGGSFVAKSVNAEKIEVHVDGEKSAVIFHNLSFVTSFVRNPVLNRVDLQFAELLAGSLVSAGRGRRGFRLRTTRGAVVITDSIQPFPELVELLLDIAEKNRTFPAKYQLAVSREPIVRTPWYGWLIIATAVGAVIGFLWWLM
jgi:hypothetical protein